MGKTPPIPDDQRPHRSPDAAKESRANVAGRRGRSGGDADANLKEQGEAGNRFQNTHNQGYQQDR
jgi:hypothetical protein